MSFNNLLNSIWQNVVAEKVFFIKVIAINVLMCTVYLAIPEIVRIIIGVMFARAGETSIGVYEFLEENASVIEGTISAIASILMVMAFIVAIITTLSIIDNDMNLYKVFKRTGVSENVVLCQAFIQNSTLCVCWCVVSLMVAKIVSFIVLGTLEIKFLTTFTHFFILLFAEIVLVLIISFAKIKVALFNSKRDSLKSN